MGSAPFIFEYEFDCFVDLTSFTVFSYWYFSRIGINEPFNCSMNIILFNLSHLRDYYFEVLIISHLILIDFLLNLTH
jgi:hypothetical protein